MAEFVAAGGASVVPVAYSWVVIADDVTFKPIRFELTCAAPVTVRVWLSRGNSQNQFTRSQEFAAGLTILDVPTAVANKVDMREEAGDYRIEVGA